MLINPAGGGGGGIRGGGFAFGAPADGAEEATSPGCDGTTGLVRSLDPRFSFESWHNFFKSPEPPSYASFAIDLEPGTCEALVGDATTVLTATVVETSSHAVDETTLPAATVISIIDEVSTVTPPTSTVNEGAVAYSTPCVSSFPWWRSCLALTGSLTLNLSHLRQVALGDQDDRDERDDSSDLDYRRNEGARLSLSSVEPARG